MCKFKQKLLRHQKHFGVCMYKTRQISKKAYKKCETEIIDDDKYLEIESWKQNQISKIGNKFLTNVIQKNPKI